MAKKAKIFISSAYEDDLKSLRTNVGRVLREAGHEPLLFEENFAPWDEDKLQTCVDMVMQSDIFILLIKKQSGSLIHDEQTTPTYIEYFTALNSKKYIIPFVDKAVKNLYDDFLHQMIDNEYTQYREGHGGTEPDYNIALVRQAIEKLPQPYKEKINSIHPFVWGFIYEVRRSTPWLYDLDIAESDIFYDNLKSYLSSNLAIGIQYVPMVKDIMANADAASEFTTYKKFTNELLATIVDGTITNWSYFLHKVSEQLTEGNILIREGTKLEKIIGKHNSCEAITVYRKENDKNLMSLVDYWGNTSPKLFYDLSDNSSYVAETYSNDVESLYFREDKQMLYFTLKVHEFVLCFHFKLSGYWIDKKVSVYEKEIKSAIMKPSLYLEFVINLIGGIRYEKFENV
ncbi:DUF4062 domain-containing protein [Fictibacillus sp. NPDC058756]|uniref:DUF4062 domain-containing protein n=1 Tax=Fictibacillus sp. NPDC058756 TaxID=3346625 RepID=UPI0036951019